MGIRFTIACVCLNAIDMVRETINSISEQTYDNYEVIFVDGMSTDGTYELLTQYENKLPLRIIHEKDAGIYDAMNKAVNIAAGDYIFFLGAGDCLKNKNVLATVSNYIDNFGNPVIICGNIEVVKTNERFIVDNYKRPNMSGIRRACGFPTSHQAFFTRTDVMKEKQFDITYVYQADQEVLGYCLYKYKNSIKLIDMVVASVDGNGFSANANRKDMQRESDRLNREWNAFWHYALFIPKWIYRFFI